jgi:CheY-like chemotaxis protein/GNAT superfamily N-acetyltransferase
MKNMRVLFVEDNKTFADTMESSLRKIVGTSVTVAMSRDSALAALHDHFFDIIVLDLAIPTQDDALDNAPEHGQTVFYDARRLSPGTPVYILTGSEPDEFALGLARYGNQVDLWGTGQLLANIIYYAKERADELLDELQSLARDIAITDAVTIDTRGRNIELKPEHKRVLQVFTRLHGGVSCLIQRVGGGLSGARTLRISVKDDQAHVRLLCIAKLGGADDVRRESEAFERHVKLLRIGAATPLLNHIHLGLRGFAGIFYALAEGYDETLFDVAAARPVAVAPVIRELRSGMERWPGAGNVRTVKIEEMRRRLLSDAALAQLRARYEIPRIDALEALEVRALDACIHGDLHGGNILVSANGNPVLIDFGDVGPGFTCLDPVTLELSIVFHPDGHNHGLAEKLLPRIHEWPNIEAYTLDNPLAATIEACRDWAHDQGGSDGAVLAAGYAFAVRQLKYDTVEAEFTLKLIEAIASRLLDTMA